MLLERLTIGGVKVIRASEAGLGVSSDSEIFNYAVTNGYILLTFDRDFGNILRFEVKLSVGVVIIYVEDMSKEEIIKNTLNLFKQFSKSQLKGKLFIVEKNRIRIWPK